MLPVKFSGNYIGNKPGDKFGDTVGVEYNFPTLDTRHVLADYRLETIGFEYTRCLASISLFMSDGTQSPALGG